MKKLLIAAAILFISGAANAAVYNVTLIDVKAGRADNPAGDYDLSSLDGGPATDATWTYDDVADLLQGTGTLSTGIAPFGPGQSIFYDTTVDLSLQGGTADASSYTCTNGSIAINVFAIQACGDYGFGPTRGDDSIFAYTGNRTFDRVINGANPGGDDVDNNPADPEVRTLGFLDLALAGPFGGVGSVLTFESADWFDSETDSAGTQMNFSVDSVVPVPAAVWLFGSALGLLGWVRRRVA